MNNSHNEVDNNDSLRRIYLNECVREDEWRK